MMDYRALLLKYIQHVGAAEGSLFLDALYPDWPAPSFTEEEWAELNRLGEEAGK